VRAALADPFNQFVIAKIEAILFCVDNFARQRLVVARLFAKGENQFAVPVVVQ